jgi:hypothetical protein
MLLACVASFYEDKVNLFLTYLAFVQANFRENESFRLPFSRTFAHQLGGMPFCCTAYIAFNFLIILYYLSVHLFSLMVTYLRWEKCTFSSFAWSGSSGPVFLLLSSLGAAWGDGSAFFDI